MLDSWLDIVIFAIVASVVLLTALFFIKKLIHLKYFKPCFKGALVAFLLFCIFSEFVFKGDVFPPKDARVRAVIQASNHVFRNAPFGDLFYDADVTDKIDKSLFLGADIESLINGFEQEGFTTYLYSKKLIKSRVSESADPFKKGSREWFPKEHDRILRVHKGANLLPIFSYEFYQIFFAVKKDKITDFRVYAAKISAVPDL